MGRGDNLMDWTYAENVAQAHVLAADRLLEAPDQVGGEVSLSLSLSRFCS